MSKDVEICQELVFHYLVKEKYKILLRDYECPLGKIDFIAKRDGELIFAEIEINDRKNKKEFVDVTFNNVTVRGFKNNMEKVATYYLKRYGIQTIPIRFIVVKFHKLMRDAEPVFEIKTTYTEHTLICKDCQSEVKCTCGESNHEYCLDCDEN